MNPIHCAIRKYGAKNFVLETLFSSDDKEEVFNVVEPQFIKESQANVNGIGYNLTEGGEGVRSSFHRKPHSSETKEKIRKAHLGMKFTSEHKAKLKSAKSSTEAKEHMRNLMMGNHHGAGYHQSDAAKLAIGRAHRGKIVSEETRRKMSTSAKLRKAQECS